MARAAIALSFCLTLAGCGALPEASRELLRRSRAAVSVVGSSATAPYARALAAQFMSAQPEIEVRVVTKSSSAAPAALAEDASAVGMMSRPITDKERDAVAKRHGRAPEGVRVAMDAEELERIYGAAPRRGADGKAVAPTEEAIAAGEYPLARPLYFYFNAGANAPATREFMRFVQTDEGRQVVKAAGGIPAAR
jgi:ABC-type phosphate transport system substrate-binding protein